MESVPKELPTESMSDPRIPLLKVRQHDQQHARKQGGLKGGIVGGHVLRVRLAFEQARQEVEKDKINNHKYGG
jgi:hypothetical protein